jgi:hypothetical protein
MIGARWAGRSGSADRQRVARRAHPSPTHATPAIPARSENRTSLEPHRALHNRRNRMSPPPKLPSRTLSDVYLEHAVTQLSEMGDPEHLYGGLRRGPVSEYGLAWLKKEALRSRRLVARVAVLMTALAAEAYANEYLSRVSGFSGLRAWL